MTTTALRVVKLAQCATVAAFAALAAEAFAAGSVQQQASALLSKSDYLGFRCLVKRAYGTAIDAPTWSDLRSLITLNAPRAGYDLIPLWNSRNPAGLSPIDKQLEEADQEMLAKNFASAFKRYQDVAKYLKQEIRKYAGSGRKDLSAWVREAQELYPFVLHSMGRALYGMEAYAEAMKVYDWIRPTYPYFRQVLFERMWAAFRLGRAEVALGAIAAQRSAYFSEFLQPEAYLLEAYIYRQLCRWDDLNIVDAELQRYQSKLAADTLGDWAVNNLATRILHALSKAPALASQANEAISQQAKQREQALIKGAFKRMFEQFKPKLERDLKFVLGYSRLAATSATVLKPIETFSSRDEYFKRNLEIWPADSAESWLDELGTHQFIGESRCGKEQAQQ